ncbi:hypothetical protein MJO29_014110 [Puccinia striiformis f. sp. tritici]|nr:hypothetical protein MJO29_014110 [Puccinia striiformis f. sp. tritici]
MWSTIDGDSHGAQAQDQWGDCQRGLKQDPLKGRKKQADLGYQQQLLGFLHTCSNHWDLTG